jgi:serine protease SohB
MILEAVTHLVVFLVEAIIWIAAILIIVAGILSIALKNKDQKKDRFKVNELNTRFEKNAQKLQEKILNKQEQKQLAKAEKQKAKQQKKKPIQKKTIFVLNFHGDMRAQAVEGLRKEISAILLTAKPSDEVLLRLESPGGVMHGYGLAASQLQRLVKANIPLTVAVDKVAASGGYMMACVANKIIAAPFAIIGSIGVVAQMPNFHRFLDEKKIDFEQITAGQFKRTMTLFGENTDADREKMQADINEAHDLFKEFVLQHRPDLSIDKVATGEHWFATQAVNLGLVDELQTSDDYLLSQYKDARILEIEIKKPKSLKNKFSSSAEAVIEGALLKASNKQPNKLKL